MTLGGDANIIASYVFFSKKNMAEQVKKQKGKIFKKFPKVIDTFIIPGEDSRKQKKKRTD